MKASSLHPTLLSRALKGRIVTECSSNGSRQLSLRFSDGTTLDIEMQDAGLVAAVGRPFGDPGGDPRDHPTGRQNEFLTFIARYIHRYGVAPAESDIQRHFMISAPSVHTMMQTLERRGFISRKPGVGRSVRLLRPLADPRGPEGPG